MEWIKTENLLFREDAVAALEFSSESDDKTALLKVTFRGGALIIIKDEDALRIWKDFQNKANPQITDIDPSFLV